MFIIIIYDEVILDDKSSYYRPVAGVVGLCYAGELLGKDICIHIVSHLQIDFLFLSPTLTPYLHFSKALSKVHLMNKRGNEGVRS